MQANENNTLFTLVQAFDQFLVAHTQVNGIYRGSDENVDLEVMEPTEFPFVFYGFGQATFDEAAASIDLEIIVADLFQPIVEKDRPFTMMTLQYQTLALLHDCVALFKHHDAYTSGVKHYVPRATLDLPVVATPFTAKYKDHVVGWMTSVRLTLDSDNNLCLVDAS